MRNEVVMLSRSLPFHSLGGMEIVTWDLARELVHLGHVVRVITTSLPGKPEEFMEEGVTIVALKNTPSGRYSSTWWVESRKYFEQKIYGYADYYNPAEDLERKQLVVAEESNYQTKEKALTD